MVAPSLGIFIFLPFSVFFCVLYVPFYFFSLVLTIFCISEQFFLEKDMVAPSLEIFIFSFFFSFFFLFVTFFSASFLVSRIFCISEQLVFGKSWWWRYLSEFAHFFLFLLFFSRTSRFFLPLFLVFRIFCISEQLLLDLWAKNKIIDLFSNIFIHATREKDVFLPRE